MKYYVVDAFADEVFKGNPAGVCVLDEPIGDNVMQKIAAENNLSETAFVIKNGDNYDLRWFTPKSEIDLCGHATLGTSYVISNYVDVGIENMGFNTASGVLKVKRNGDLYEMDLPLREPKKIKLSHEIISETIGIKPVETYLSRDLFIVLETEEQVKKLTPNFSKMVKLDKGLGVIVTAKGTDVDFVSRCFYPKLGVNEDPVTGSAHSNLVPFWSRILNKRVMVAKQLSERGGILYCKMAGDRVKISGRAVPYMIGDINIIQN
ncbi:PhzF family phenazine biosynthesis protein [Clostridium sp. WLY-B-L2]|uniref:PhzF family phenazine biosynthesis protein n=1 Tax=Clostridium aromativorans TaxID=2836848 RepID=A0ABS8N860_9CLOT|nr:PhzF family phenazine biosynthesis protein [Clostridium aromativorans]MCC9295980.1 PhzF family phenazine biosynthesis protein [Clostridium aromativorans]